VALDAQILLSRGALSGAGFGTCLTNAFRFDSGVVGIPAPVAGSFGPWRTQVDSAPGGAGITITIRKNGTNTSLVHAYGASDTSKTDTGTVAFAAGDVFDIERSTGLSLGIYSRLEWVPDDGVSQIYSFFTVSFDNGRYLGVLNTTTDDNAADANVSSLVGADATVTALRIKCDSDPGVGKSRVYTLYKNGVAQDGGGGTPDTRATNSAGTTTASATFSLSVSAGDRLSVGCALTGGATAAAVGGSIAMQTSGDVVMYGGAIENAIGTGATTPTRYYEPYPQQSDSATDTESDNDYIGADGLILSGMRIFLSAAPGGSGVRTFTLRENATDTDLEVAISGATATGSIGNQLVPIGYSDVWTLREVVTNTPVTDALLKFVFVTGGTLSQFNALLGSTHTVEGSTNLIVGENGTVTGDVNALFALCDDSPTPSITGDRTFKVCAETIELDATTITINGEAFVNGDGGGSGGSPSLTLDGLSDVVIGSPLGDGDVLTYDSGSGLWTNAEPSVGSGGSIYPDFTSPALGDFTWVNQGTATTTTNANGGIFVEDATAGSLNIRVLKKAAPATPYTITTAWLPQLGNNNFSGVAIGFRQSSDGKLVVFSLRASSGLNLVSDKYSSATAFSASYTNDAVYSGGNVMFLRITDNGTNRICSWSVDGYNFRVFHTVGRTDFLTADEVFFGLYINTVLMAGTITSWAQT
jgi:hypothetical protein